MKKNKHPLSAFNIQILGGKASIKKQIKKYLKYIFKHYKNFEIKKEKWDDEYSRGRWDYLNDLDELSRYSIIIGYINHIKNNAEVLDVGCGKGVLLNKLREIGYKNYFGIDLSEAAIGVALDEYKDNKTNFEAVGVDEFFPTQKFDVIVFNECLYYFEKPLEILKKYSKYLNKNGRLIVSMYGDDESVINCWDIIDVNYEEDSVAVINKEGIYWVLKILKPIF